MYKKKIGRKKYQKVSEKRYQEVKKCTIKGRKVPKTLLKFKSTKINWIFDKRVTDDVQGCEFLEFHT